MLNFTKSHLVHVTNQRLHDIDAYVYDFYVEIPKLVCQHCLVLIINQILRDIYRRK